MKLELLLTLTLLAIAMGLWNYANTDTTAERSQPAPAISLKTQPNLRNQPEAHQLAGGQPRFTPLPQLAAPTDHTPEIQLASYIEEEPQEEHQQPQFLFANYTPSEDQPANILVQAARNLTNSPPISCKSRMKINMFDQLVVGTGQYLNAGQGSGLTRLDLKFDVGDEKTIEVNQICDGKFFYRIEQIGEMRKIEFLDLSEFVGSSAAGISDNPTQWLSRSGTISMLRNLGTAFDFAPPANEVMAGLNILHLHGQWKPAALENILYNTPSHLNKEAGTVNWQRLPKQVPHGVDIYLGNDEFMPLFPYRIVFFQYDTKTNTKNAMVTMELFEVEKVAPLSPDLFRVSADDSQQVDLSNAYHERIKQIVDAATARVNRAKTR